MKALDTRVLAKQMAYPQVHMSSRNTELVALGTGDMEYEGTIVVSRDLRRPTPHVYQSSTAVMATCGEQHVRDGQLTIQHDHARDILRYITRKVVALSRSRGHFYRDE